MLQKFCEFATDYPAQLRTLKDPVNMQSAARIIQFPFAQPVVEEKTEEELARMAEKRKEQGRKLQEMAAKSRQEKVGCTVLVLSPTLYTSMTRSSPKKRATFSFSTI